MFNKKILYLFFIFLFSVLFTNVVYGAIGVSPASVSFEKMLRAGYAERLISVSNPSDEDIMVSAGAEGNIKDWIKIESGIIIKGRGSSPLKITVVPPSDVLNGVYEGEILIIGSPVKSTEVKETGARVISAVMVGANVEITDLQIIDFDIKNIYVLPAEECRPIFVGVNLINTGNVKVEGDFHVDILDSEGKKKLQETDYKTESMLSTKDYKFNVEVPYELEQFKCIPEGKYKANVTFSVRNEVKDNRIIDFNIAKRGTYTISGKIFDVEYPRNVSANQLVEIKAKFKNTGSFPVKAKLVGKVYLEEDGQEELKEKIEGERKEVNSGSADVLTLYFIPKSAGEYRINLYGRFEDKETEAKDIYINVVLGLWVYAGIIVVIVILAIVLFVFVKRKGKDIFKKQLRRKR